MPITYPFSTDCDDTCIKFMVRRDLSDKIYLSLGLLSPLIESFDICRLRVSGSLFL